MKRILSAILVIALCFAFFAMSACSEDEETDPPSDSNTPVDNTPEDTTPGDTDDEDDPYAEMLAYFEVDSVPDPDYSLEMYNKLMAGDIMVGFCLEDFSQNYLVNMANGFVEFWEDKGAKSGGVFSADGDVTVQATQIENCATIGMDLICVASATVSSLAAACQSVQEQGVKVIVRGEASVENCGFVPNGLETYPNYTFGWTMADMAIYYAKEYNPDIYESGLKVATGELSVASNLIELFSGVDDRLALDEQGAEKVYIKDWCLTIDDGYNVGEECLTYDPDIRAFMTFDEAPAIGFNNYIMSNPSLDPAEFICIATSASTESAALWELSKTNESVMRGYCGSEWEDVSVVINNCSWKVLMGLVDDSECWLEFGNVNPENVIGYTLGAGGYECPEQ